MEQLHFKSTALDIFMYDELWRLHDADLIALSVVPVGELHTPVCNAPLVHENQKRTSHHIYTGAFGGTEPALTKDTET